jgi:signal transduction histidine kinase/CheY-like chemotaxis protein
MRALSFLTLLRRSFRTQLTALAVLLVVLTNLILVGGMTLAFLSDADRNGHAEVESVGRLAATALIGPLLEANYAEVADIARDAVALKEIGYIQIALSNGVQLVQVGSQRVGPWSPVMYEQPLRYGPQTLGSLRLQMSNAPWESALPGWLVAQGVSICLSLGLAYLLFHGFIRTVEQRIQALKQATEAFVAGHTEARADLSGEDELAEFGRAFDAAMQDIATSQARLRDSIEAAQAANVAKSRFLATMSHEIRTPLNGVLGLTQLMLMAPTSPEDQQKYLRTILSSGTTLLALLNDVLDLSKVEAGRLTLETLAFSPAQLLHDAAALMEVNATDKGLGWTVAWTGGTDRVLGDPHRLRQMLSNLMGNAVKFTETGHIHIQGAEVDGADSGGWVCLRFSVQDTGIGIAPDKLGQLFKPFSQVDASDTRKFGGTGLGLSIVRSLAEQMGGRVGVDSVPGQGSTFWFEVRLKRHVEAEPPTVPQEVSAESAEAADSAEVAATTGCVLLVEDNLTNRMVVEKLLLKAGYRVLNADNGAEGVACYLAHQADIHVVLMDVQMPVMDGLQATRTIRQHEAQTGARHTPVVGLTANAYAEDRTACLAAGMDDFVTKPISVHHLLQVVAQYRTSVR